MRSLNQRDNHHGMVLVTALIVMTILMGMGVAMTRVLRTELKIGQNHLDGLRVFYDSESAIEHSIAELLDGVDVDGDGLGSIIVWKDLDSDGDPDYRAEFTSGTKTIVGYGSQSTSERTAEVQLGADKFTGAFQIGGGITAAIANGGTLNGNVDAVSTINLSAGITVNGTVTQNNTGLVIPTPSMTDYSSIADYTSCAALNVANPPPGLYYITGNCTISGISDFNLNGTIVTTGTLTIASMPSSFTITPTGENPAVVTGSTFTPTAIWNPTFNGMVYVGGNANLSNWMLNGYIDGALVVNGSLDMQWVNNLTVDFDPAMDPPYFTGGGSTGSKIVYWKAH